MDDKGISYEMLQDLLRAERRSNKMTPVQPRFWSSVRDFLAAVKQEFLVEQEKDPFSRKAMMLRDEVQHAQQAAEGLWALRERKMSLFALAQVKDTIGKKPEGITRVEEEIYDAILEVLRGGRNRVLAVGTPPGPASPSAPSPGPDGKPVTRPDAKAKPKAQEPEPPEEPAEPKVVPADTPVEEMVTIRALADIPPFVGPDMQTYLLKEGDVATVPPAIAKLLERRKKAEPMQAPA